MILIYGSGLVISFSNNQFIIELNKIVQDQDHDTVCKSTIITFL